MTLNSTQFKQILILLSRVTLEAKEAMDFVMLSQAIANELKQAEENEKKSPGIPMIPPSGAGFSPEAQAQAVASSETTENTPRVKRAIKTILREARKQNEGKAK